MGRPETRRRRTAVARPRRFNPTWVDLKRDDREALRHLLAGFNPTWVDLKLHQGIVHSEDEEASIPHG